MTTVGQPKIGFRSQQPYMGTRTHTPMKGMSKAVSNYSSNKRVGEKARTAARGTLRETH